MEFALPKWPQMRVIGKPIDPIYAREIIRRTDSFFSWPSGNNKTWVNWVKNTLSIPNEPSGPYASDIWAQYTDRRDTWLANWGYVETNYVRNDWISSSFIFGPHGWCHPDGKIFYADNVGKWPESTSLIDEWTTIAKTFPGLHINIVFMNGENVEEHTEIIFGIFIRDQEVLVHGADQAQLYWDAFGKREFGGWANDRDISEVLSLRFGDNPMAEVGISREQIIEWGQRI